MENLLFRLKTAIILRKRNIMIAAIGAVMASSLLFSGCSFVPQMKREYLSDPIMGRQADGVEAGLEGHDFPRREGSVGGSSGSGGGCGC